MTDLYPDLFMTDLYPDLFMTDLYPDLFMTDLLSGSLYDISFLDLFIIYLLCYAYKFFEEDKIKGQLIFQQYPKCESASVLTYISIFIS